MIKKLIILIGVIILLLSVFLIENKLSFAQNEFFDRTKLQKVKKKIFFNKLKETFKELGEKIFNFWQKIHQTIKKNWKEKLLPKIINWLKKEISLIKEEFKKELEEIKKDISK